MRSYVHEEMMINEDAIVKLIREESHTLQSKIDLQPLFEKIANAKVVMLGEASHGTHEYYMWRSYITRKLIEEKGFRFIAVEGDWPDCYRLNRFIKGYDQESKSAFKVLESFRRWPTWMWANWEMVALADWLAEYNKGLAKNHKAGFYGLDVYSLWESMEAIISYLGKTDKKALKIAEGAFQCFEPYRKDEGRSYAQATMMVPEICENEVVDLLREIRLRLPQYNSDPENVFSAEQNGLVAVNAEKYYRSMIHGGPHSWNVRDRHMMETLERLLHFHGEDAKVIVWAHNTHIGDARATDMVNDGMFNIGELARMQLHDKGVFLVGFGSYRGTVTAGRSWGGSVRTMQMPEAREHSWEWLLHQAGKENKLLIMDELMSNDLMMENHLGHRAVGVVYNPQYEKYGNYVPTIVPLRYDAFIYLDETHALHPIHIQPDGTQIPETYPFGF